jgi:hypothetical protein
VASWNSSRDPSWPGVFVANAQNADFCSAESGTSSIDLPGCYDDGDGWADFNEPLTLRDNPTQWKDSDFDGYGDNWGDASWTPYRDSSWPGQYIEGATNADLCPKTPTSLASQVDLEGCMPFERDSDFDGVYDDSDNCPNEPKGVDGYDDGCPYIPLSGDGEEGLFGIDAGTLMVVLGGGGLVLALVLVVVLRVLRGDDDDDDDEDEYDDFFDDDDEEESFLDKLDKQRASPTRERAAPKPAPAKRGPTSPPSRGGPGGPPGRASAGPPKRGPGGPPRSSSSPNREPAQRQKVAKKKSVTAAEETPSTKVRKAKINVDLGIFDADQEEDRIAAVDWVVGAFSDGEQERTVLMQLQETGWSAQQSRAICDLAKNKGA